MKTYVIFVVCLALNIASGCSKSPVQTTKSQSETEPVLSRTMSDAEILRALGLNLSALTKKVSEGPDGESAYYSDDENEVCITYSAWSGVTVVRLKPEGHYRMWKLGKSEAGKKRQP